ncbi:MAG: aromatic amino acid transport family protein [Candidatus Pacebacteria bacterium]|nr:aromatic amino acid transport family protein [Candidatus Paceibacterota bacterium]
MPKTILAGASLAGTIIGAGVFAIPYVFSQSGVIPCLIYFIILTPLIILLHLFFGEITLRTREEQRLVGYVGRYLGKKAKALAAFSIIAGTIGSLLVYIILSGDFLSIIFPHSLSSVQMSILVWGVLSFLVFLGTSSIALVELMMGGLFILIIAIIFLFCLPLFETFNLTLFNANKIFLPFGVLMFSLIGWSVIGEAEDILTEKKKLKTVITAVISFCAVFYFFFGLIISGVSGQATSSEAMKGLVPFLGYKVTVLGALFGFLAVSTSFLTLANYLRNTFAYDYRMGHKRSFALACFAPLILFLTGFRDFIAVISVLGTVIGLIEGVALIFTYKKAKTLGDRTPEYSLKTPAFLLYLAIFILAAGTITELFHL